MENLVSDKALAFRKFVKEDSPATINIFCWVHAFKNLQLEFKSINQATKQIKNGG
ncbi:hypothetical protein M153_20010002300 [Pseudoloma neurophilia]|uniref:Uncharacterized protein n=1 Tax=Pseudoloma neurophilia TaxID=146866 RepID=A0A0R0LZZ9_9MICR|nr:hypothetical protein M153_20010002300 [Pseudoloma neurophilia]